MEQLKKGVNAMSLKKVIDQCKANFDKAKILKSKTHLRPMQKECDGAMAAYLEIAKYCTALEKEKK